jgi:hypothetical protein
MPSRSPIAAKSPGYTDPAADRHRLATSPRPVSSGPRWASARAAARSSTNGCNGTASGRARCSRTAGSPRRDDGRGGRDRLPALHCLKGLVERGPALPAIIDVMMLRGDKAATLGTLTPRPCDVSHPVRRSGRRPAEYPATASTGPGPPERRRRPRCRSARAAAARCGWGGSSPRSRNRPRPNLGDQAAVPRVVPPLRHMT